VSAFLGKLGDSTVIVLTSKESRLLRDQLTPDPGRTNSAEHQAAALRAYNAGIARGTALLADEFAERQRALKKK
jgi:hypothetical protein